MKKLWLLLAPVLAMVALSGCFEKAREPFRDAPTTGGHERHPAQVHEMPDGFSNFASKCDGPNMVYVVYHGNSSYASLQVVKDDPRCGK
jgi:hypothetical protein